MREGWKETTLGEIATWYSGSTPKATDRRFYGGDIPFLTIADLTGQTVVKTANTLTAAGANEVGRLAPVDAVFLSMYGSVGRTGIAGTPMATNQAIAWAEVDREVVSPEFLLLILQSHAFAFDALARGATQRNINRKIIKDFPIALAPKVEQERIVELISSIDSAIQAGHERLELGEVASSAVREAAWLSSDETLVPLSEMASIEASMVDPKEAAYRTLKHVGVAQIEKETGRILDAQTAEEEGIISAKFLFSPEDIVYSKIRPNLRKVAMPGFTGLCSADAYPLRPNSGVNPHFLRDMLLSEPFTRAAVARSGRTKMPKINRTELFSIDIPSPAPEIQARIGNLLSGIRDFQEATRRLIDQLTALRAQVLRVLVSGEHAIPESYDRFLKEAS